MEISEKQRLERSRWCLRLGLCPEEERSWYEAQMPILPAYDALTSIVVGACRKQYGERRSCIGWVRACGFGYRNVRVDLLTL